METVNKIGTGTEQDPIRPNTLATSWRVIEERETEFIIEMILNEN